MLKIMPLIIVFALIIIATFAGRKSPGIISISIPPLLIFGVVIAFMSGCSRGMQANTTLQIPEESAFQPATITSYVSVPPSSIHPTPDDIPSSVPMSTPVPSSPAQVSTPTPQVVEVPVEVTVEVPRDVIVELPGKTVEVIKEVYMDTPLDGMDMRVRQLEFIDELNAKYIDVFGMIIGGGEYCYGFTSHTEYLIGYYFITDNDEFVCSYEFPPLSLNADQATIDNITNELVIRNGE